MSEQIEQQLEDHLERDDEFIRRTIELEMERDDGFTLVCNHCGATTEITSKDDIPLFIDKLGNNPVEVQLLESERYDGELYVSDVEIYCIECNNTATLPVKEVLF